LIFLEVFILNINLNLNIKIRRLELKDIDPLFDAVIESKNELKLWLHWCHEHYSKSDTIDWIAHQISAWDNGDEYSFAIVDELDKIHGGVGLNFINKIYRICNLGYWIRTSSTNKNIASTASIMAAKFAFEKLGMNRVEIIMSKDNLASERVAQKIGAFKECLARRRLILNNEPIDALVYSLIEEDLDQR
jgi:RimJ/RimL family protein N-acetyltransferase